MYLICVEHPGDFLMAVRPPHPGGMVRTGCGEGIPIRTEEDGPDLLVVDHAYNLPAAQGLPYASNTITCCGQAGIVGAEVYSRDPVFVSDLGDFPATDYIPDPSGMVLTGRGQVPSFRAENNGPDEVGMEHP
jgi:hypothetical protein